MIKYSATYSPDDNKIRLYASARLDAETYARVKAAGFGWAPKQELFVAPKWTPERAELAIELAGELEDDDKSLAERAEERAERFEDYSDKRESEANRAHEYVASIADGIPLGQPILVGHHSERHARKDAQRIENGMRKAVSLWETSKYWERRAKGALAHAKYKELPTVRARRIRTLEAEMRVYERALAQAEKLIGLWPAGPLTRDSALQITSHSYQAACFPLAEYPRELPASQYEGRTSLWSALGEGMCTPDQARTLATRNAAASAETSKRWLEHLKMRLIYERCMLEESGYVAPPKVKSLKETLPLCNYRAESITYPNEYHRGETITLPQIEMTKAQYAKIYKDYKGTRIVDRSHKVRIAIIKGEWSCVFLTDSKVHAKPGVGPEPAPPAPRMRRAPYVPPARTAFDDMRDSLKAGVQVVSAPQLFPTPPDLAARMVELAEIEPGHVVVEPSAGTGRILLALDDGPGIANITVHAVEINASLCEALRSGFTDVQVHQGDFMAYEYSRRAFADRVLMNPPFVDGSDIIHIHRAISILKPGGRVVAVCADGPRQNAELRSRADTWEQLPAGTFASQGTNVRTVLATFSATEAA